MAVRVKGSARKIGCADCFLFFRQPAINGCLSNLLFKPPATVKPVAIYSLPHGEGWGEGILRISAIFPNTPTTQNTSLAACCPLSSSLPRGERTGWLLGLRIPQGKRVCSLLFLLFRRPFKRPIQAICILLFSKYNQNQSSATVQAAFPILATRAGFLPVHRLSAAKFRGSKNAAR